MISACCNRLFSAWPVLRRQGRRLGRRLGRGVLLTLALMGILGCSLFSFAAPGSAPAGAPPIPSTAAVSPSPTRTAAPVPPSPTPLPGLTLLPTFTPIPSQTPFLSATPPATLTPAATSTPGLAFAVTPSQSAALFGKCCTLRVRNAGSIPLWIGKGARAGSVIKPLWYLEFYYDKPQTVTVYWCLHLPVSKATPDELPPHAPGAPNLYECRHRDIYVEPGVTETSVTQ